MYENLSFLQKKWLSNAKLRNFGQIVLGPGHLAVRNGKKSPKQESYLGNRGHLKVLNDTKLILID